MPRKRQQSDDSQEQQLDLGIFPQLSPQQPVKKQIETLRTQRVDTRQAFTKALVNKRADGEGVSAATDAMYKEAFGKNTRELYETHGGKKGNRDTLPEEVQEQLIVHEILNKQRVSKHDVKGNSQDEVNDELTDVVAEQTRQNKGFFGKLFGG